MPPPACAISVEDHRGPASTVAAAQDIGEHRTRAALDVIARWRTEPLADLQAPARSRSVASKLRAVLPWAGILAVRQECGVGGLVALPHRQSAVVECRRLVGLAGNATLVRHRRPHKINEILPSQTSEIVGGKIGAGAEARLDLGQQVVAQLAAVKLWRRLLRLRRAGADDRKPRQRGKKFQSHRNASLMSPDKS